MPEQVNAKIVSARKVRINRDGYEAGKNGGYYGVNGPPVYRVQVNLFENYWSSVHGDTAGWELWPFECRADDRAAAIRQAINHYHGKGYRFKND